MTLEDYANLDGTEVGELCLGLIALQRYHPYFLTEGLKEAIAFEVERQLLNYKENCEVVEETEVIERTVKYLDWN